MVFKIFVILPSTIFKVPKIEFQVIPNQFKTCVGSNTDFSSLTVNPALPKSFLIGRAVARQSSLSWTVPQPSSRKMAKEIPCNLQCFSKGFKSFVKT